MAVREEHHPTTSTAGEVVIRPLEQADVDTADRIMRTAFGTFLGAPDPLQVFGDAQYVRPRFAAEPSWAFAVELDGELVGSNFATKWGSLGFFGPLTVRPDLWDRGLGSALMEPIIDLFDSWQAEQAALFTFPQSVKHIGLYQKFGFWPQQLTPLSAKPLAPAAEGGGDPPATYSAVPTAERQGTLDACRELTGTIFDGLDLEHEIRAVDAQALGDTVLLGGDSALDGLAVCHLGAGEAGSGTCYVKFGAVRPGPDAGERFEALLDACETLAAGRGLGHIVAGVNAARHDAYRRLLARGYRPQLTGVIMQRPNAPGCCRPDAYVIDDLR